MVTKPDNESYTNWLAELGTSPDDVQPPTTTIIKLTSLHSLGKTMQSQRLEFINSVPRANLEWILEYGGAGAVYLALLITSVCQDIRQNLLVPAVMALNAAARECSDAKLDEVMRRLDAYLLVRATASLNSRVPAGLGSTGSLIAALNPLTDVSFVAAALEHVDPDALVAALSTGDTHAFPLAAAVLRVPGTVPEVTLKLAEAVIRDQQSAT